MTSEEPTEDPGTELDPFGIDDDAPLPPRQGLGALGQLAAGVIAVVVLIVAVLGTSAVLGWMFR